MSLEDGAVLGECLARIQRKSDLKFALTVYEACRKKRTSRIVERGNLYVHMHRYLPTQRFLNMFHFDHADNWDWQTTVSLPSPRRPRAGRTGSNHAHESHPPGDPLAWRDPELSPWLLGYNHLEDVSSFLSPFPCLSFFFFFLRSRRDSRTDDL